jgi:hypothetical protein
VIKSADLAEWMLADTQMRELPLIVDACYSGMVAWTSHATPWPASERYQS